MSISPLNGEAGHDPAPVAGRGPVNGRCTPDYPGLSTVIDIVFYWYGSIMERTTRVTIRDVAERAGVSVATVSKVLNDRYGVAADTHAKVRAVIDDLGYEASIVAQSLRNHRTNVIGILIADVQPFSTELLKGAADAIRESGFELVVYSAGGRRGDRTGWERRYLSRLSGTLVDGALIVTPTVVDVNYGAPIVAVDPHTGPSALPTVESDNLRGGRLATEHLLELGHRRIGILTGRDDLQSAQLRERGYRMALASAGVRVDEDLVQPGAYDAAVSAASARTLLASPDRPTAVFAANDVSGIATVEVARELGLSVPEDLSVIGFDNVPQSALCAPPLTTVDQHIQDMGRHAMELVIRLIRGEAVDETHVRLETELVVRGSTAPPR
jgi:LacI family transcriptional regulator